ncbi:DUF1345 domain-containing protein [Leucobacter sp. CSA2]|uniref:DUF1345 domain-containing protein n=1 Tax=Leucobacter edaphi TaxID=2796472 RepID=A0A934QDJ7_9MICO|nr:DUF1345 domain-containing protein [Leucobacter edaphi]MBK0422639.1 DUF1345 domain-containing protein [Leucobacter edaphi]
MDKATVRTRARWRRVAAALAGIIGAAIGIPLLGVPAGLLIGWAVLLTVSTGLTLLAVWRMDGAATRSHATIEDPGRRIARFVAVVGSVASLAAVLIVIIEARHADGLQAVVLAGIAIVSVASSWFAIQTNYMLHYARVYFEDDGSGGTRRGIDFNEQTDPCYSDFAYFAVGLGLTYQVSDTNISDVGIRRIVIAQTLLAYLFGAGIIATVINLVAGLG